MKINLPGAVDLLFLANSETKKFVLKFKDNYKRWIKTIFKNKIGHKIFYTWWFIIPVLPGIHDCGIAFAAVGTRACSNVTIFDNRCCFVCSFAVPWINVNWVVLSWDRCDFKSVAWTYFTILERFTNLLTIFKGYRVYIIGTIPLFQVRIEIGTNKSIRKTVPCHLLPISYLGDDINSTNCIGYLNFDR